MTSEGAHCEELRARSAPPSRVNAFVKMTGMLVSGDSASSRTTAFAKIYLQRQTLARVIPRSRPTGPAIDPLDLMMRAAVIVTR